jgi:hypothetical protein
MRLTAAISLAVAAVITLVLIAAMAYVGFGRAGAASSNQPRPQIGLDAGGR